jgi:hypothetical protein
VMRPSNGCGKRGRYPDRVPDATHANDACEYIDRQSNWKISRPTPH